MRDFLPIAENENLITRGKYVCYCHDLHGGDYSYYEGPEEVHLLSPLDEEFPDDEEFKGVYRALIPSGIIELWTIHELPDQSQIIRCDRQVDGSAIGMQVVGYMVNDAFGQTQKMEMQVHSGQLPDDIELVAEATYIFADHYVDIIHRALVEYNTMGEQTQTRMDLPAGYKVDFGWMTISKGLISRDIATSTQSDEPTGNYMALSKANAPDKLEQMQELTPLFSPYNPGGILFTTEHILKGELEYFSAQKINKGIQYAMGKVDTIGAEYQLDFYDKRFRFGYIALIDKHGVILREGTRYIYCLTEYERFDTNQKNSNNRKQ